MTIKHTVQLGRKLLNRTAQVAVVGQGYVGLSLACAAAEAGFTVVGVDMDRARIEGLAAGQLCVAGIPERTFKSAFETGRLSFDTDRHRLSESDVIAICVPTPVRDGTPDLSYVERAASEVAEHLHEGQLVVLESTTYPGTTNDLVRPLLEASGLSARHDFLLAYSPERVDPGNDEYDFANIPRIVGGISPEATGVVALFYGQLTEKVLSLSSCHAAELAKLLENTFRHVNIALVNEMAMLCHDMNIDVWEVIEAAASKPFGFMRFEPGPGVGGHCIPLDPAYLAWQVRKDAGRHFRILEEAQDINGQMPVYVASRIGDALNEAGKAVKGADILALGVAYKPDVGDLRESPALKIMSLLQRRGARVRFHDPFFETITVGGTLLPRTELTRAAVASADLVTILTPHNAYDLEWIADHARLIFDARNAFGPVRAEHVVQL